ncbi:MAG: response regulator [Acidobacteria bacterium]|nr:response regulator [Acidobacteriota bacterium]
MPIKLLLISNDSALMEKFISETSNDKYSLTVAGNIREAVSALKKDDSILVFVANDLLPAPGSNSLKELLLNKKSSLFILISEPENMPVLSSFKSMGIDYLTILEKDSNIPELIDTISKNFLFDAPYQILLLDAGKQLTEQLKKIVSKDQDSFNLTVVTSGEAAIEKLLTGNFDTILIDSAFNNKMTAIEILKLIQDDPTVNLPVILLSMEYEAYNIREAFLNGAMDFINLSELGDNLDILNVIETIIIESRRNYFNDYMSLTPVEAVDSSSIPQKKEQQEIPIESGALIFDSAINGILICNKDGKIVKYNEQAIKIFGFKDNNSEKGNAIFTLFDIDHKSYKLVEKYFKKPKQERIEIETVGVTRQMLTFPAEIHASTIPIGEEYGFLVFVKDISEREERKQQERQQNEELFLLYYLSQEMRKEYEIKNIISIILERSLELSQSNYGVIYLREKEDFSLEAKHAIDNKFSIRSPLRIPLIPDHYKTLIQSFSGDEDNIRSKITVPLISRDSLTGLLELYSAKAEHFRGRKVQLLETLGSQMGVIIENAQLVSRLEERGKQLQELSDKLILVQEEERKSISSDLHDMIGQSLSLIKIYLQLFTKDIFLSLPDKENEFKNILNLLNDTINATRDLATRIHPTVLDDLGLISGVEWFISTFPKDSPFTFKFTHPSVFPKVDEEKRLSIFRILTEAVSNAVKHSEAKNIKIYFEKEGRNKINIRVIDDGRGFNLEDIYKTRKMGTGIGLLAIKERAAHINAECEIISDKGKGCEVKLTVPLK